MAREIATSTMSSDLEIRSSMSKNAPRKIFGNQCIVWEGDPATFKFLYVSDCTKKLLGYPASDWMTDNFWAGSIVHPADRADAIAYGALAAGKGEGHDFIYRAVGIDGSTVHLHDIVKVVLGSGGIPAKLRGLMFPVASPGLIQLVYEQVQPGSMAA